MHIVMKRTAAVPLGSLLGLALLPVRAATFVYEATPSTTTPDNGCSAYTQIGST